MKTIARCLLFSLAGVGSLLILAEAILLIVGRVESVDSIILVAALLGGLIGLSTAPKETK